MPPPDTAIATQERPPAPLTIRKSPREAIAQLERVVLEGNLATLTEGERVAFYARVCESLGLNPLTRPFEYITLNGKLTLYARKDATDQLRDLHGVTIERIERDRDADLGLSIVTAYARDRHGRVDSSIGAVSIKGLAGEAMANALMKAETKAKRRVTLSICGLGWMDEIEALDQRAVEVAPRTALKSAIAERTAALTGGASHPGESEASAPVTGGAEAAEGGSSPSAAGSPACAHDPKKQEATERGVVCSDCGTLLAERAPEPKPRTRARKTTPAKKQGDEDYWRARAHAMADERGLDPEALKRVAGAILGYTGDWSRKDMVEADWEQVASALDGAPVRSDDEEAWLANATVFAGNRAIAAGLVPKLADDADWEPVEASAMELIGIAVDDITPAGWTEYGLRIGTGAS